MGLADWLGLGKDPVLEHLARVHGLERSRHAVHGRSWEGKAFGHALCIVPAQRLTAHRSGLLVELGDCAHASCFGFYRPDDEDLREAADFGPDWLERYQEGAGVRLGRFLLEYEGDPEWQPLIGKHAVAMADYLGRCSDAVRWVDLRMPGLAFQLGGPAQGKGGSERDLRTLESDVAVAARLLDFTLVAAGKDRSAKD